MRAEHHFAHSLEGQPRSRWQGLRDHLEGVAAIAADLARSFGSGEWALLAGLWHDVGKYRHQFQAYIDPSAPETSGGDHAIGGALLARRAAGTQTQQLALAAVIAAHHAGLANLHDSEDGPPSPLMARLDRAGDQLTELSTTVPQDLLDPPLPPLPGFLAAPPRSDPERRDQVRRTELWIRFLLSALVDADRLDTEAFYDPETARARGRGFDSVAVLRQRLDLTIDELAAAAPATAVNQARGEVLARCRAAAAEEPGFFSLTVPTGGGKTLSALSFALRHAETHGLGRVITAIPYTSIIEQTARVFRQALNVPRGNDQVIEHHSNLDPEDETAQTAAALRRRWASETWDAPIIVTTNVQLFESLFSNRPSRCRKLHNVSRSVLVLDEAQSLPAHLLLPLLDGKLRSSFSMTEAHVAGSDPTGIRTRAVRDGDAWVIDGHKWFASNADIADFTILMAVTDPDAPPHRRASMFVVPKDTPGMRIVRSPGTMSHPDRHPKKGRGGSHCEVYYEGARIPLDHLIGQPGQGFQLAQTRLGGGRIHHAMRLLGQTERAFDMMIERAASRESHGRLLRDHQMVQDAIALSAIGIETQRLLTLKAAWTIDRTGAANSRAEIAMIKYYGAKVALEVIDRSIQIHGSLGYTTDLPLERMYRMARALRIADGADEVHKVTIAKHFLRGVEPVEGWPSEWLPAKREAAVAKFRHLVDLHVENL